MTCEMEHGVFLFHWLISIHFLLITCIPKCLDLLGIILIPLLLGHSGMLCEFYIYIYILYAAATSPQVAGVFFPFDLRSSDPMDLC